MQSVTDTFQNVILSDEKWMLLYFKEICILVWYRNFVLLKRNKFVYDPTNNFKLLNFPDN